MPDGKTSDLQAAYSEICRSHDGIAEFRAKLLGFLPLASGVGILFLLGNGSLNQSNSVSYLVPVGLFGVLITYGLFLYELRGIHRCRGLIRCAQELEKELLVDERLSHYGAFRFRSSSLWGVVGAKGAALVIYPTVIGAWAYLLAVGLAGTSELSGRNSTIALIFAAILGGAAVALGAVIDQQHRRTMDEKEKKIKGMSKQTS